MVAVLHDEGAFVDGATQIILVASSQVHERLRSACSGYRQWGDHSPPSNVFYRSVSYRKFVSISYLIPKIMPILHRPIEFHLPQRLKHLFNTSLLLFHIWVDIEVEGCADIRVPK